MHPARSNEAPPIPDDEGPANAVVEPPVFDPEAPAVSLASPPIYEEADPADIDTFPPSSPVPIEVCSSTIYDSKLIFTMFYA